MKKRSISILMLVWLFSQQLFASVWSEPNMITDCDFHDQRECIVKSMEHIGHAMPMIPGSDTVLTQSELSMTCDDCCTICQSLLITVPLLFFVDTGHLSFDAQPVDAVVSTFISTLYRPPIIA